MKPQMADAIDPGVALTKLPGAKVVQRAADKVVAKSPVLQGLNQPVNDISRGCPSVIQA